MVESHHVNSDIRRDQCAAKQTKKCIKHQQLSMYCSKLKILCNVTVLDNCYNIYISKFMKVCVHCNIYVAHTSYVSSRVQRKKYILAAILFITYANVVNMILYSSLKRDRT